jgi:hypothetical protein
MGSKFVMRAASKMDRSNTWIMPNVDGELPRLRVTSAARFKQVFRPFHSRMNPFPEALDALTISVSCPWSCVYPTSAMNLKINYPTHCDCLNHPRAMMQRCEGQTRQPVEDIHDAMFTSTNNHPTIFGKSDLFGLCYAWFHCFVDANCATVAKTMKRKSLRDVINDKFVSIMINCSATTVKGSVPPRQPGGTRSHRRWQFGCRYGSAVSAFQQISSRIGSIKVNSTLAQLTRYHRITRIHICRFFSLLQSLALSV